MELFSLFANNKIGNLTIPVTIQENYNDTLTTTEHPIETGAAITDHAYANPSEITMRCGWTQSSSAAIAGAIQSFVDFAQGKSSEFGPRYIDSVYAQLLTYRNERTLLTVQSTRRKFSNMLIVGLQNITDKDSNNILVIEIRLKQIIVVSTQASSIPLKDKQGVPSDTMSPLSFGKKSLIPGLPSPGGSLAIA